MLQILVRQITSQQVIRVDIFDDPDGPKMTVTKKYDYSQAQVIPAYVFVNINFGDHLSEREARRASRWYGVAADLAEQLDSLFFDRDCLRRWADIRLLPDYSVEVSFRD